MSRPGPQPPDILHPPLPSPFPLPVQLQTQKCFNRSVAPTCPCPLGKIPSNGQYIRAPYSTPYNRRCKCQHLGISRVCCPERWPYNQIHNMCFQTPIANAIAHGKRAVESLNGATQSLSIDGVCELEESVVQNDMATQVRRNKRW